MTAKFRIQAVAEKTGVPAATLRAWERRYGVPLPRRTNTAYRMYSEEDIHDILQLRDLCRTGMSVGEAAAALKDGLPALPAVVANSVTGFTPESAAVDPARQSGAYGEAVARFVEAMRRMDVTAMNATLAPAALMGSPLDVYEHLIVPALIEVGELWHQGSISIGHEHLATELISGTARQLLQLAQPATPNYRCILACFAEEPHALPLYGIGLRLAAQGCQTHLLGARTPPLALAPAVRALEPALVGLSATTKPEASKLREWVDGYNLACGATPWIVGGRAAPELRPWVEKAGGYIAERLPADLDSQLRSLLHAASSTESQRDPSRPGKSQQKKGGRN